MARSDERLEALEATLSAEGADKLRLELVRRARIFKRSWLDMAEALTTVRSRQSFLEWGYDDFHSYCQLELLLTRATVDKLTGSFTAVAEHAPQVLQRDGIAQPVPTMDAVDYFAKALRHRGELEENEAEAIPGDENVEDLRRAVFEEQEPISTLRREFNSVFYPRDEAAEARKSLEKTRGAAKRLEGLLMKDETLDRDLVERAAKVLAEVREAVDAALSQDEVLEQAS